MTCLQCGAKEVSSRRDKYQKIGAEYDDLIIKNIGGHPEPEEQVCKFKETYLLTYTQLVQLLSRGL